MKLRPTILLASIVVSTIACKQNNKENQTVDQEPEVVYLESGMNQVVPDTVDGGEMLLGFVQRSALEIEPFGEYFETGYTGHRLDTLRIDSIRPLLENVSIRVFMGSWCEDSQREVPALMRILDLCEYDTSTIEIVALDHDKKSPDNKEEGLDIEYIPTIIFSRDGEVLNRIVEYPVNTLEMDMLAILKGEPYKHYYED